MEVMEVMAAGHGSHGTHGTHGTHGNIKAPAKAGEKRPTGASLSYIYIYIFPIRHVRSTDELSDTPSFPHLWHAFVS